MTPAAIEKLELLAITGCPIERISLLKLSPRRSQIAARMYEYPDHSGAGRSRPKSGC